MHLVFYIHQILVTVLFGVILKCGECLRSANFYHEFDPEE